VRLLTVAAGEHLLQENSQVDRVYCLVHGTVSLWKGAQRLLQLAAPQVLGMEGYFADHRRSPYAAVADTDLRVAAYSPSEIQGELLESESMGNMALQSLSGQLRHWWQRLDQPAEQCPVYYPADLQTYAPGQTVIREGESSRDVYRVVSTDAGLEVTQNRIRLNLLNQPGDFFGEMAALLHQPRNATVRSIGHSVLEVYPPGALNDAIAGHPDLALRMITSLAQRLADSNLQLSSCDGTGHIFL